MLGRRRRSGRRFETRAKPSAPKHRRSRDMPRTNDEARRGGDLARAPGVCLAADSSENKAPLPLSSSVVAIAPAQAVARVGGRHRGTSLPAAREPRVTKAHVIGSLAKNSAEDVVVSLDTYRGVWLVDIRV